MQYFDSDYVECFMRKCCGCCESFAQGKTIILDYRAPGMGGNEVVKGVCDITGRSTTNRTSPCNQWKCQDGVMVAPYV